MAAPTQEQEPAATSVEPPTVDVQADGASPSEPVLPGWFVVSLGAVVVWCATAGVFGTVLLVLGWYQPLAAAVVATVASVAAGILAARRLSPRRVVDQRSALIAVGLVAVFLVLAGAFHSEHLLLDRDPAVYLITGRTIAGTHQLHPKTLSGAFADGTFGDPNKGFDRGFFPMLPVLLAQGWSIGGDRALLFVGPILGTIGLLAAYALASRVLGPRSALLALALLIVEPLQLWFARDAYSELVVQVVALGGLWLYLEARSRNSWPVALVGGALVASAALARVDVLAITCGVVAFGALDWVRCDDDACPNAARRAVMAFVVAVTVGTAAALTIAAQAEGAYLGSLDRQFGPLAAAFALSVAGFVGVVVVHRLRPGLWHRLFGGRRLFVAGTVVASAVFLWAYFLRPAPAARLPATGGAPLVGAARSAWNAWHYSRSLHWFAAYFGVAAVFVAFAGFVLLANRARHRDRAAAAIVLVALPTALIYLARPSITPDQPWAMRRFLPVVIPAITIAIAAVIVCVWRAAMSVRLPWRRAAAVVGVAALGLAVLVPPAYAARPFVRARAQHGADAAIHGICRESGDDAAVLVFGGAYLDVELPDVIRAFCGVPTAKSSTADLPRLAQSWRAAGRRLVVVTAAPTVVKSRLPGAMVIGHHVVRDDDAPQRVFDKAPRRLGGNPTEIWVLAAPDTPSRSA